MIILPVRLKFLTVQSALCALHCMSTENEKVKIYTRVMPGISMQEFLNQWDQGTKRWVVLRFSPPIKHRVCTEPSDAVN